MSLLVALDALLEEGSVTKAAERLRTSPPAMSRTLGRLRRVYGDALLVRAGQGLVPTPFAVELRDDVRAVVQSAQAVLTRSAPDLATAARVLTVQANEALLPLLGPALWSAARETAPGLRFRFLPEEVEGSSALRDGRVDLEVGVIGNRDPEVRSQDLATDRICGLVRAEHPLACGRVTAERIAAAAHISVSRRGRAAGPLDDALADLGLRRTVAAVVPSLAGALLMVRESDLVCLWGERIGRDLVAGLGLKAVTLPFELPALRLGMAWHPRLDGDGAHRWLRAQVTTLLDDQ